MEITDQNITLRKFTPDDAPALAMLCNNSNIWDNLRDYIPNPYTEADAAGFINHCLTEHPPVTFAITYKGNLAGCIGLVPQTDVYRLSAEIGYWVGEPFWAKGIATRAVQMITRYGFEQLGLLRIYSGVFGFNTASQRVLEKAGYKLECVFEKSIVKNNRIADEYRYAKLNEAFDFKNQQT
ncbi:MAG: GNAT family N-acetyltransferase [Paludibacter sp.]